ncbi:MAG: hypothetical protein IRY83_04075 [Chloroflexi bacterium]|nr:hypothetical protein [Chloroflexota bacterium]
MAYLVNPHGATHSVPDDWAEALLRQGFRLATAEEIAAWHRAQGLEPPAEVTDAASEHGGTDCQDEAAHRRSRRR